MVVAAALSCMFSLAVWGQEAQQKKSEPKKSMAKEKDDSAGAPKKDAAPAAAEAAKPIEVDAGFIETLDDYQLIQREIGRLEAVSGMQNIPVSIAQLRQRGDAKLAKLKEWIKEREIGDDWIYNAQLKSFTPPEPKKAEPPAKAPDGKGEAAISQGPGGVQQIGGNGNRAVVNGGQGSVIQKGGKGNTALIKPAVKKEAAKP